MPVAKYRPRLLAPVAYEAVHWTGDNCAETFAFLGLRHAAHDRNVNHEKIDLPADSRGRTGTAWPDDWILHNTATGDFESYGDEDFRAEFEPDVDTGGPAIRNYRWGQSVGLNGANDLVDIPFNDGDNWAGNVIVGLDDARVLHDMLGGLLEEVGARTGRIRIPIGRDDTDAGVVVVNRAEARELAAMLNGAAEPGIRDFTWGESLGLDLPEGIAHVAVNDTDGNWVGDIHLDIDGAMALADMLAGAIANMKQAARLRKEAVGAEAGDA